MSSALGAFLQGKGFARGVRVAIMMPNVVQYVVTIAAILRAGFVVVNVNALYTARELEHQLKDSGAEAIVILENFAGTLEEVIESTSARQVIPGAMGDLLGFWKGQAINFAVRHMSKMVPEFRLPLGLEYGVTRFNVALGKGMRLSLRRHAIGPDNVAFLQYTGGTTGGQQGRGASAPQRGGDDPSDRSLVQADARQAPTGPAADRDLRAAALSHLRAHHLLHDGRATRDAERADPLASALNNVLTAGNS